MRLLSIVLRLTLNRSCKVIRKQCKLETKTNENLSSDSLKTSTNESKKDIPNQSKKETDKKENKKPENLKK